MQTIYAGFMGKGNCGKGTQAKLLAEKYNLKIISTGNLLRE
jgi:adenylate kinase family enzyme